VRSRASESGAAGRTGAIIEGADEPEIVRLSGDFDLFAAQGFRERMSLVTSSDRLVVDLSGLSFIDSAGLHALFSVGRAANELGARIAFVVPADSPIRRVVELVLLSKIAPVCDSLGAAIARVPAGDAEAGSERHDRA
jgi:anti-sigma B factor antagonist